MSITESFTKMDYGEAANFVDEAKGWIDAHDGLFGPYLMDKWRLDLCVDDSLIEEAFADDTNTKLASVKYASNLFDAFQNDISVESDDGTSFDQSCLRRFVDIFEKKVNVVAGLEALSTGRSVGRLVNFVFPKTLRWLRHLTSEPTEIDDHFKSQGVGAVLIAVPSNISVTCVLRHLGPALMTRNKIYLHISKEKSSGPKNRINLALFYLTEVAKEANLPLGSLNIMYDVVPLTNSVRTSPHQIHLDCEQERTVIGTTFSLISVAKFHYVFVVCDSADLSAAAEEVSRAIADCTQEEASLKIFVQESVYATFIGLLRLVMEKWRFGKCTDPTTDFPSKFSNMLNVLKDDDDVQWVDTKYFSMEAFRTAKEAVNLVNAQGRRQLRLSLWTELIAVALEVSEELVADTIWINCYGEEDTNVEYKFDLWQHVCVAPRHNPSISVQEIEDSKPSESVLKAVEASGKSQNNWQKLGCVERARKLKNSVNSKQNWELLDGLVSQTEINSVMSVLKKSSQYAANYSGCIWTSASFKGKILNTIEPWGIVAIVTTAEESPLISLASVAVPALVAGNTLIIAPSADQMKIFSSFIKILGLPAGVITMLENNGGSSSQDHPQLAINSLCHTNIRSIFYLGTNDVNNVNLSLPLSPTSSYSLQYIQLYYGPDLIAFQQQQQQEQRVVDKIAVGHRKLIWLPSGVTFAT